MRLSRKASRASACWLSLALTLSGCVTGCSSVDSARAPAISLPCEADGFIARRITTEHFDIISTLCDAEFERAIPDFMEAVHERCQATLPAPSAQTTQKLHMCVFATRGEWVRFTRTHFPERFDVYSKIRSGGYTEGTTSVSFYTTRAATLAALAHEGWHQYIGSRFRTAIPAWLNEGLACCHEAIDYAGSKPTFRPKHNTFRINSLREALQQDKLLTLSELIDTNTGEVLSRDDRRITRVYYAQAWALIAFLRYGGDRQRAAAFDGLLHDITAGSFGAYVGAARLSASDASGMSFGEAAFRAYFGCAPESLSDHYREYVVELCGL